MAGPIRLPIVSKFDNKGVLAAEKALVGFGKMAGAAAGLATVAVAAFGVASVRAFASFDSEMNKSLAIMGEVSEVLRNDMSDAAREVAKTTTFSADQAAESYFFLASAGLDAASSIQAMPQVARFAQAGMFDMALATDLLTDAQSALGLTIKDDAVANMENMVRVSDTLVKANTLANASVEQFSTALTTKAGAALRIVNKDVEEGVAVLAAFADQGIKGEIAGTQLGIVLRDLSTKALSNKADFKQFGIEVFDANGNMNNMADIVGDLEGSLDGMSDATAKATLLQLGFSDKSLASLMSLMGTSEAIREYERELRNAAGTTDEISGKQLETFSAQLELLKSRFTDVMLSIGEGLVPTLITLADQMGPILDELAPTMIGLFEELAPVISSIAEQLPSFITAMTPLIPVIGDLALLVFSIAESAMPALQTVIEDLSPVIGGFTTFLASNGEVVGALIISFALFNGILKIVTGAMAIFAGTTAASTGASTGFFAALTRGAGPIAAAIALILTAAVSLYTFRDEITKSGTAGRIFSETWAAVTFGVAAATHGAANMVIIRLNTMVNAFIATVMFAVNGVRKLMDKEPINVPINIIPTVTMPKLEDYRRDLGLDVATMTFTPKNLTGYAGAPALGVNDRRAARGDTSMSGGPISVSALMGDAQGLFTEAYTIARNFQFRENATSITGLGQSLQNRNEYNITVNSGLGTNGTTVGEDVIKIIQQYERTSGPVFARYTG
jgi:TP901 family phage tail tape measure protein